VFMNEETVKKWITKAESDLKIGKDEMLTDRPATDAFCFHVQQCVEKYLKAFLIFNGKEIRPMIYQNWQNLALK